MNPQLKLIFMGIFAAIDQMMLNFPTVDQNLFLDFNSKRYATARLGIEVLGR
jgi:hypothetical protein